MAEVCKEGASLSLVSAAENRELADRSIILLVIQQRAEYDVVSQVYEDGSELFNLDSRLRA